MIKNIQKKYVVFAFLFVFCSAIFCFAVSYSPLKAFAASDSAYNITYDESGEFTYSKLEKTDYAQSCTYSVAGDSSRYDGVYGKTAIRRYYDASLPGSRNLQLYFRNTFAKGKSYEISFWIKFNSPAASSYVLVWYSGEGKQNENRDLPQLKCETGKEGEWIKYTVPAFRSDDKGVYENCFILTLECENFAADTEIFFDEFHAYEVADDKSLISGEDMSENDWTATSGTIEKSSFNDKGADFALKLQSGTKIESKFLNMRTNGVLRIRFAYKAESGSVLYFGIKDAFGNVIEETELTIISRRAIINAVTVDLKTYDFVKVFFRAKDGAAVVGLIEVIPHNHEFEDEGKYPINDRSNCTTIRFCKLCETEVSFVNHKLTTIREATCDTDGRIECTVCHNYSEVIPATGKHVCDKDITCSPDNPRERVKCKVCGKEFWLQKTHTFKYYFIGEDAHLKRCVTCGYEERSEHRVAAISLIEAPTEKDNGTAVCTCEECDNSFMTELPSLDQESAWVKTVVKEVTCENDGREKYVWKNGDLSIELTVEATGHEYEEIHTSATCETEGKSVYHKCRVCGDIYEKPEDIITFAPLGHSESEWITEIAPTTRSEGLQRKYCNRCNKITEERVVPKLNDSDYDKYILEDPEKTDGYLYRYTSKIYGTFTEYEPKSNGDKILLIVLPIVFVVALVASVALFIIFTEKGKSK